MSKYTTEVRFICEHEANYDKSVGYTDVETVLEKSHSKIFQNYPIFNEAYRAELNKKILRHYYTREIAFETVGLWKLKLNTKMREIMPYYNQLYESELLEFDPFNDVDTRLENNREFSETGKGENESDTDFDSTGYKNTSNTEKTDYNEEVNGEIHGLNTVDVNTDFRTIKWDKFSDTPQGSVTDLDSDTYLTNARKNTEENNTKSESIEHIDTETKETTTGDKTVNFIGKENTGSESNTNVNGSYSNERNNTTDFWETLKGKRSTVSYSNRLMEFRETFLNIDMMVINELWSLFFTLYD